MLAFCANIVQRSARLSQPTIMTSRYKPSVPVTEKAETREEEKELHMATWINKRKPKSGGNSAIGSKNGETFLRKC